MFAFLANQGPESSEPQCWKAVGSPSFLVSFGPGLSRDDRIYGELFPVAMERQLEAIRQQFLKHDPQLLLVGRTFHIRPRQHIELFRFEPGRSANDLPGMNPPGERDEIAQRRNRRGNLTASRVTRMDMRSSGLLGLMVATSNTGSASAGIACRTGGSGMAHAVRLVARVRFRDSGSGPWDQVPAIKFPSALSFPS